jgi:hypothetical protein
MSVELVIKPKPTDLGEFTVRRVAVARAQESRPVRVFRSHGAG